MLKNVYGVIFIVILLVIFPMTSFAKEIVVSGKIFDTNNNPVAYASVVFVDSNDKTIGAAVTDTSGSYNYTISSGIYSMSANGPEGSGIKGVILDKQEIKENTTRNFNLEVPKIVAKKELASIQFLPLIIGGVVAVIVILGLIFFIKNKKLSKPGSSN